MTYASTPSWTVVPPTSPIMKAVDYVVSPSTHSKTRKDLVTDIVQAGYYIRPTGSRVTKSGWSNASDWDYAVLDTVGRLIPFLGEHYTLDVGGSGNTHSKFTSYKFRSSYDGEVTNLIVVKDKDTFEKYMIATETIKAMDCKTKEERIKYFNLVFGVNDDGNQLGVPF